MAIKAKGTIRDKFVVELKSVKTRQVVRKLIGKGKEVGKDV